MDGVVVADWDERPRIHHISCTLHSGPDGTASFEEAHAKAIKLERYARKAGFEVMYENVDRDEQ